MNITVTAKNVALTNAMKEYSEKKVQKLEKYFDSANQMDIQVHLDVEKNMHIAEILVHVHGLFLKGIEKSEDMYGSIDLAIDKIERQIVKYKEKLKNKKATEHSTSDALKLNVYDYEYEAEHAPNDPKIVISKSIPAKPMDIEEAIMQMELLNKNFFVFRNAENSQINVVYKRDDKKIGLIES